MRYCCIVLVTLFISNSIKADIFSAHLKDPFYVPQFISCEELAEQLVMQLNVWEFSGYIHSSSFDEKWFSIIWLTNNNVRIQISDLTVPELFLPWQIIDVSEQKINWETVMPLYCGKKLTVSMAFKGR